MTQDDKDILLKDLCARLPYGVKISVNARIETLESADMYDYVVGYSSYLLSSVEDVKPYLLPLSSMTKKQMDQFNKTLIGTENLGWSNETFDWLNKNHFDYRGLIPMGLAEDATDKNIY